MTRSLNFVITLGITLLGSASLFAHDGHLPASQARCGCSNFGTTDYIRSDAGYSSQGCFGMGGCSTFEDYNIPYKRRYQQSSPPRFETRPRFRRPVPQSILAPSIPKGMEGIANLDISDQHAALRQRTCPVTKQSLGSMGTPIRVSVYGRSLFVCCKGCVNKLNNDPQRYLTSVSPDYRSLDDGFSAAKRKPGRRQSSPQIPTEMEGIALLPELEQAAALRQRTCPVTKQPLGSMGKPLRVNVAGRSVFVCCEGCVNALKNNPQKYLSAYRPSRTLIR